MKLHVIHFAHNTDLPENVRAKIADDVAQTIFRAALNTAVAGGASEMHSYIKAYKALSEAGYERNESGAWNVKKDGPAVADVHVPKPLGAVPPKTDKKKPPADENGLVVKRISGNSDISLNSKGRLLADKLGERIAIKGGLDVLYTSSLPRAIETGDAIAKHNPHMKRGTPAPEVQPWHLGELEGKQPDEVHNLIAHYIENPEAIPNGKGADGKPAESFEVAVKRQLGWMKERDQESKEHPTLKIGVVMHSRGMELLKSFVDAGCPDDYSELDTKDLLDPDDPTHADMLRWHGGKIKEIDLESDKELKPGFYLILHSLTDDDTDSGNRQLRKSAEMLQKKYLAPIEVHRAAKSAYDGGNSVIDITAPLAEQEGLPAVSIQKIADHFAAPESATEPEFVRNAWGGPHAARWAGRVLKKLASATEWESWVAFDLDGTLTEPSESYDGTAIGAPIPAVVAQLKAHRDAGDKARIFTARVANDPDGKIKAAIEAWCQEHLGEVLPVTNEKDPGMTKLYDDKAKPLAKRDESVDECETVCKQGNGVMLAFVPSPDIAHALALLGGEPQDQIHLTLAYFGRFDAIPSEKIAAIENAVQTFCANHPSHTGTIGGPMRFAASEHSEGRDVVVATFQSSGIQEFRRALMEQIKVAGVEPKANFGYVPHLTLAFVDPKAGLPVQRIDPMPVEFGAVVLFVGGARKTFALSGQATEKRGEQDFEIQGTICKLDKTRHLVFGWFSIVTVNGRPVQDTQGDIITAETIEDSAYDFVLNARTGGEMHDTETDGEVRGVGRLVESVVFTSEKVSAMLSSLEDQGIHATIDLGCIPWWGGMRIDDEETWDKVVSGKLRAWSIGGKGKRASVSA